MNTTQTILPSDDTGEKNEFLKDMLMLMKRYTSGLTDDVKSLNTKDIVNVLSTYNVPNEILDFLTTYIIRMNTRVSQLDEIRMLFDRVINESLVEYDLAKSITSTSIYNAVLEVPQESDTDEPQVGEVPKQIIIDVEPKTEKPDIVKTIPEKVSKEIPVTPPHKLTKVKLEVPSGAGYDRMLIDEDVPLLVSPMKKEVSIEEVDTPPILERTPIDPSKRTPKYYKPRQRLLQKDREITPIVTPYVTPVVTPVKKNSVTPIVTPTAALRKKNDNVINDVTPVVTPSTNIAKDTKKESFKPQESYEVDVSEIIEVSVIEEESGPRSNMSSEFLKTPNMSDQIIDSPYRTPSDYLLLETPSVRDHDFRVKPYVANSKKALVLKPVPSPFPLTPPVKQLTRKNFTSSEARLRDFISQPLPNDSSTMRRELHHMGKRYLNLEAEHHHLVMNSPVKGEGSPKQEEPRKRNRKRIPKKKANSPIRDRPRVKVRHVSPRSRRTVDKRQMRLPK
ncbi:hypothetical protein PCE1_003722 [Barthelona sp. PCE]